MLVNHEINEVAKHCGFPAKSVLRVYHGGGAERVRERVKTSAAILGLEPPPERDSGSELQELNFDY